MNGPQLTFEPGRPPSAEIKRLAIALSDDALRHLEAARHGEREEAVHEARKRFKETRALLRLVARGPNAERARSVRMLIRDAGRSLSAARDADVLAEAFGKLLSRFGAALEPSRALRARILATAAGEPFDETLAIQLVGRARNIAALWSLDTSEDDVSFAVRRGYRAAREAMFGALSSRSPLTFHEWRKREKDHWYHSRLVSATIPSMLAREPLLHRLSRLLGDHHDLVLVREAAAREAYAKEAEAAVNLCTLARQRMRELEREAEVAGAAAFGVRAKELELQWNEPLITAAAFGPPAGV